MNFGLDDQQTALRGSVERFCERSYDFRARAAIVEGDEGFSREHWRSFAELGWLGAGLPESLGGFGGGAVENAVIAEVFGRALVIEPFMASAVLALQTLAALPAGELRDRLMERIVAGEEIVALAHNEPAARGDIGHVESRAVRHGAGWRLTGHKSAVLAGPWSDHLLVSAATPEGVHLFCIEPATKGVRTQRYRLLDHTHVFDVWFADVELPEDALLAGSCEAIKAIESGTDHAIVSLCAGAVGAMDAAISITRDYLKTRKQFGVTLSSFQVLQHRLVDMFVKAELSRSALYQGLAGLELSGDDRRRAISITKAVVSEAGLFVGQQAVQLHGGIGMTEEYAIGHYYRYLFVIASLFGNENMHLRNIASLDYSGSPVDRPMPV